MGIHAGASIFTFFDVTVVFCNKKNGVVVTSLSVKEQYFIIHHEPNMTCIEWDIYFLYTAALPSHG